MASTADDSQNASQEWLVAQKIRRASLQELERVKKPLPEGSEVERFMKLDDLIAQYRLKCMVTLYCDIVYASKEKVETTLWTMHVMLNSAYRKIKDKYEKQQKMVTKRSIEKLYETFIKTSQMFYKAHLQRLCACYPDLPELQRLVAGGVVDKFEGFRDTARVDAVAAGVKDHVLTSAYLTLNYLGDLWRYRTQLKHAERRKYDAALAYYRLATDLDPHSGYAYHQMGVIFLEQDKHFDIVYHFYRSLAAEKPHPNAAKNLESEFNRVLKASPSLRGQGHHHALQEWIVRLHAHFYPGQTFSQHAELEDEVLHRLGLAVKAHDFVDGLVKLALLNICAYQIAKDRITLEWTAERSQTCQFTLRLNIRTIEVILRQLEPELVDLVAHMREPANQQSGNSEASNPNKTSKFNALVSGALPLLRVYMTWLCMYRSDVVQFEPHLQPYAGQMYKSLSAVLLNLFEIIRHYPHLEPVPYLFPEDMEAFGLKALSDPAIPPACLLGIDSITRTPKLRPEDVDNSRFSPDDVSFTRALDITTCGFVLADDHEFPLAIAETQTSAGQHLPKATYQPEAKPPSPIASGSEVGTTYASPPPAAAGLSAILGTRPSPTSATVGLPPPVLSGNTPKMTATTNGFAEALTLHGPQQIPLSAGPGVPTCPPQLAEEANYAVDHDRRMNDLVNGLLEPSEFDPSEAVFGQEETSYGMHTATARDVFASALQLSNPGLPAKHNGPHGLPWTWDSVAEPALHHGLLSSGSPRDAWLGAAVPLQPALDRTPTGGVSRPGDTAIKGSHLPPGGLNGHQTAMGSTAAGGDSSWDQARQHSYGTGGTSTAAGASSQASPGFATSAGNPWNQSSSKFSSIQDILGAQLSALVPGLKGIRPMASTPAPVNPAMSSSFGLTNFSGATSSLPPVNSPWGVPVKAAGGIANSPGHIGRPPGLGRTSRPNSNSSAGGASPSTWHQDNIIPPGPVAKPWNSRTNGGPTTPRLSAAPNNSDWDGLEQSPVQTLKRDAAYEAMLRKLQKPGD